MTKTKNFPHRRKARREKAREQVVRRLAVSEAALAVIQKKAHGAPKAEGYAKEIIRAASYVERVKGELACLDANIADNRTGKTRRKAEERRRKLGRTAA